MRLRLPMRRRVRLRMRLCMRVRFWLSESAVVAGQGTATDRKGSIRLANLYVGAGADRHRKVW
jgi:hypothetical protein